MPQIKFEVIIDTGYANAEDAETVALNFLAEALHKALEKKGPVTAFSSRLLAPGEAEKLEEWKVLIAVPWHLRTPEQQVKIDELALWFSREERVINIGAITQGEKV